VSQISNASASKQEGKFAHQLMSHVIIYLLINNSGMKAAYYLLETLYTKLMVNFWWTFM
jgi:hypothetical protein